MFLFPLILVFREKMLKSAKKSVDIMQDTWYYIQVDAIRQQNKSQNR